MRLYFEVWTHYGCGVARYLCVYVGLANAKGSGTRLLGFELSRMDGRLHFRTWPALKAKGPRVKLRSPEEILKEVQKRFGKEADPMND